MKKVFVLLAAGAMLSGVAAYVASARTTPERTGPERTGPERADQR